VPSITRSHCVSLIDSIAVHSAAEPGLEVEVVKENCKSRKLWCKRAFKLTGLGEELISTLPAPAKIFLLQRFHAATHSSQSVAAVHRSFIAAGQ
jgi:hypothetical protein